MKPSALFIAILISVVIVTPSLAKKPNTNAQLGSAASARAQQTLSRDDAIQHCNAEAAKWRYSDWQAAQLTNYGACMKRHGQPE